MLYLLFQLKLLESAKNINNIFAAASPSSAYSSFTTTLYNNLLGSISAEIDKQILENPSYSSDLTSLKSSLTGSTGLSDLTIPTSGVAFVQNVVTNTIKKAVAIFSYPRVLDSTHIFKERSDLTSIGVIVKRTILGANSSKVTIYDASNFLDTTEDNILTEYLIEGQTVQGTKRTNLVNFYDSETYTVIYGCEDVGGNFIIANNALTIDSNSVGNTALLTLTHDQYTSVTGKAIRNSEWAFSSTDGNHSFNLPPYVITGTPLYNASSTDYANTLKITFETNRFRFFSDDNYPTLYTELEIPATGNTLVAVSTTKEVCLIDYQIDTIVFDNDSLLPDANMSLTVGGTTVNPGENFVGSSIASDSLGMPLLSVGSTIRFNLNGTSYKLPENYFYG